MSYPLHPRKATALILLVLLSLVLSFALVGAASAEGAPYESVPGYPKLGCYEVVSSGMGMFTGNSLWPLVVWPRGPVVDAYLVWIGTEDVGAPDSPNQSDLGVNGTTVVGQLVDSKSFSVGPSWYMWRADIGPNGYNLVHEGENTFNLTGWYAVPEYVRRNGASIVVVYDTGACERPSKVELHDSFDYYYSELAGEEVTAPIVYEFPPAPVNRSVHVWLHHAGTDSVHICRPEQVWAATGAGSPPGSIISYGQPSTGINGGKLVLSNAFSTASCGGTSYWPVTLRDGGWIDPEWSVLELQIEVPAGATYLVLQGESVKIVDEEGSRGESGAWFADAVIPYFNPELKIAKTDGVAEARPGDTLTYTIDYENYGYGPADDVIILDKIPDRSSYASATAGGVYDDATRTVKWEVGTLDVGETGQVEVTVKLDPVYPAGITTITNEASISTTTPGETDLSDNTTADSTDVTAKTELSIDKSADPEPVDAGGLLTYTVDWTVGGDAFAEDVTIVDTLPELVSFVSATHAGLYDPVTHQVTWLLGDVTPLTEGTYTVIVEVDSPLYNGTTLENYVVITDAAGNVADDEVVSVVRASHELLIDKTAAPEPVDAGTDLTYTIDWAVTGNEPAMNATIIDTLPDIVTFVSATGGGVYDPATHKITWSLGELLTPQNGTLEVVVAVPSPLYDGTKLTNVVDFMDDTPGSTPVSDTVISTVRADHELVISKADSPDPVAKGAELTYTIDWSVTGNEPADNVQISDRVPFGTQFVSASDGGSRDPATNTVTWLLGDKVPGDSGSVTLVVKVNHDFPNDLDVINVAVISDDKPGEEKQAEAVTGVIQTGSIGDTVWVDKDKSGIQEPDEPGLAGVRVVLHDAGADGLCGTADDAELDVAITDGSGKYRFTGVLPGSYCVAVDETTVPGGLELVTGDNPHGPVALAEGEDYRDADFGYAPKPGTGTIGDRVWSDADGDGVQDAGEAGIEGVTVDLIDAGDDGSCGSADDAVVASAVTGFNGLYLFTGVTPGVYCVKVTDTGGVLTGLLLTGGHDPHGPISLDADETYLDADFGYQGRNGSIGDLVFYDANRNGLYELGPAERGISGVTISLKAPGADGAFGTADDVTVATATTDFSGGYLFTGLADGEYHVVVTDTAGRLVGYTQTYGLPDTDNNGQVSPYPVTIAGGSSVLVADFGYADGHLLNVLKTNDVPAGEAVEAGAEMTYTISYSVSGREAAPNVMLRDQLPTQLIFLEASDGGTYDAATRLVTWSLGTLEPGASGYVTLRVLVTKPQPNNSYIFNNVTIIDDAGVTDKDTDIVRVHAEPILTLTKANDPTGEVVPGDTIEYTLCYANTGNGNATGVVLTDGIPFNTTYVAGSATGGGVYDEVGKVLTWDLATLGPDAEACVRFKVMVNMTIIGSSGSPDEPLGFSEWITLSVDNVAVLSSNELPDVEAAVSNVLKALVDPVIYKSVNSAIAHMGDTVVFTVTLTNNGTANATNVVVTDVIDPQLEFVNLSTSKGTKSYDDATRTWTVTVGELAPAETVIIKIWGKAVYVALEDLPYQIINMAQVQFEEGAPRDSNEVIVDVVYYFPGEIPEPATWLMLGSGLAGLAGYAGLRVRARRRKSR